MEKRGAISAGLDAVRHGKLILLLALTAAGLGLLGSSPIWPSFQKFLGETLNGDHFIRNHPGFAPTDFIDFYITQRDVRAGLFRSALAAALAGILLQAFFAGGIIAVLGRGRFAFGQFFEPARRNLWHNVKCLLLFLLAASAVLGGWFAGTFAAARELLESAPPDATIRSVSWWAILVVGALLAGVLSLVYDFARAARRYSPTIGAWRSVRFAFRVLRGTWTRALALFALWLVAGTAIVAASLGVAWALPSVSWPAIVLLFAVQLGALWLRSAVRIAAWGSYVGFLDSRARRALSTLSF